MTEAPSRTKGGIRIIEESEVLGAIAWGRRSTIFALADGRALKAYPPGMRPRIARNEFRRTRAAYEAGAPAWRVDELAFYAGGLCILGERVEGETLAHRIRRSIPDAFRGALTLASLSVRLARIAPPDPAVFGSLRRRRLEIAYVQSGRFPQAVVARSGLCHGDLNPNNVMIDKAGRAILVDWSDAYVGPVVADVCWSSHVLVGILVREREGFTRRLAKGAASLHRIVVCARLGWPLSTMSKGRARVAHKDPKVRSPA
ncbi:aminoglycoside phosphotransferase family protein [Hansschlegelia quercus]|uniref:Aminoglycoside phosphotransferase domain-containing protein n=1 Tax=Hansschlegelia quercus TaxID=2528245 RepID=A0A4Q9GIC4_9HYPH|nr:phosphotransferase [Hansschlegelia quercus]TBN53778.1 hypothetical protein EYR15_08240 [Hansschlegelia quercus]